MAIGTGDVREWGAHRTGCTPVVVPALRTLVSALGSFRGVFLVRASILPTFSGQTRCHRLFPTRIDSTNPHSAEVRWANASATATNERFRRSATSSYVPQNHLGRSLDPKVC